MLFLSSGNGCAPLAAAEAAVEARSWRSPSDQGSNRVVLPASMYEAKSTPVLLAL